MAINTLILIVVVFIVIVKSNHLVEVYDTINIIRTSDGK